jgi:hypothetical protein
VRLRPGWYVCAAAAWGLWALGWATGNWIFLVLAFVPAVAAAAFIGGRA